jgi:hypothetical protein
MMTYINRYGDAHHFDTMPNGNIKWTGNFEWHRCSWPNVYDKAYAQYVADGGTESELVFKTLVHEWDNEAVSYTELAKKYMHLVYSDTESIDMVDPSGGPYIATGMDMGQFNEAFKGKKVTGFVPLKSESGYEIVIKPE